MAGISSKAMGGMENAYKFNAGTELDGDLGINMYETAFRGYDAQLGRFTQFDPMADSYTDWSPYTFAFNDPVFWNDPLGAEPGYDDNGSSFNSWLYEQYASAGMLDAYYQMVGWQQGMEREAQNNYYQNMALVQYLWGITPNGTQAKYNNVPGTNGIDPTGYYYKNTNGTGIFVVADYHGASPTTEGESYYYAGYIGAVDFGKVTGGIDPSSFRFTKTSSNWQEAGVSKLKFTVRFIGGTENGQVANLIIQYPLVFGLPIKKYDGTIISPTQAAKDASKAFNFATDLTKEQVKWFPEISREQLQSKLINNIKLFMLNYGGRVDRIGSGNPKIKINEAKYEWF